MGCVILVAVVFDNGFDEKPDFLRFVCKQIASGLLIATPYFGAFVNIVEELQQDVIVEAILPFFYLAISVSALGFVLSNWSSSV